MKILLSEFIKTGKFGEVSLGDLQKDTFNKLDIQEIEQEHLEFNNLELQFNNKELVCIIFFINHCGVYFENLRLFNVIDFHFFKDLTTERFKEYCLSNSLEIVKEYHLSQDISIKLKNQVNLVFENNKLTSIAIMDNLKL